MTHTLSPNTQAILLLTAPLVSGRGSTKANLLTPGEYKRLARCLRQMKRQPADLLASGADDILRECQTVADINRLQQLLGRGFQLSQAVERWQTRAIWIASRADEAYPRRFKSRLQEDAPAIIYGCGDVSLLDSGGLAVVGSRHVDDDLIEYTTAVGQLAARARSNIVSGGAKGVDQAAMRGALEAGGTACGVLADRLERAAMAREHRNLLLDGQLTLISPYDPSAGFNVGHAMQRNKLIYALADAALVVSSDLDKGGTWAGATEQLEKFKFVPVYVRASWAPSKGLDALRRKGALAWPELQDEDSFAQLLVQSKTQSHMPFHPDVDLLAVTPPDSAAVGQEVRDTPTDAPITDCGQDTHDVPAKRATAEPEQASEPVSGAGGATPADALFRTVQEILHSFLKEPRKEGEVADALQISKAQAKSWLERLVSEGAVKKTRRPIAYVATEKDLFSSAHTRNPD